jgi:hypothetical protein
MPHIRPIQAGREVDMESLLTRRTFSQLLAVSCRSLDRKRAAGEVLEPLAGPGQPRWLASEVVAWIAAGRPSAEAWRQVRRGRR